MYASPVGEEFSLLAHDGDEESATRVIPLKKSVKSILKTITEREIRRQGDLYFRATKDVSQAAMYDGLNRVSLSIASATHSATGIASVNLVLPVLSESSMFAGIRTAIELSIMLANARSVPLRIVYLRGQLSKKSTASILSTLTQDFPISESRVSFIGALALPDAQFSSKDTWITTYWTTAHAVEVASRLGMIDPTNVHYLVQDYEPGFFPWSTENALARSTYHAGFDLIVNSSPVAEQLCAAENVSVDRNSIFRPSLDLDRLEAAADRRAGHENPVRVTFYARPNKPRNMYGLGMAAMQAASSSLYAEGISVEFASFGDSHARPRRGHLQGMKVQGKLGWADYFVALAESNVVLSLQSSPHPSHPPLDAVVSGGIAVTNDFNSARSGKHPRLLAVPAEPWKLGEALTTAVKLASATPAPYDSSILENMGRPISDVVSYVASKDSND